MVKTKLLDLSVHFVAAISVFFLGLSPSLLATTLYFDGNIENLSKAATCIAETEVTSVSPTEIDGFPYSEVKATALDVLKGQANPGDVLTAQMPGGKKDGKSFAVMGLEKFAVGQHYLLFLDAPCLSSRANIVGWQIFRIHGTGDNKVVTRGGEATVLQRTPTGMRLSHDQRRTRAYRDVAAAVFRSLD